MTDLHSAFNAHPFWFCFAAGLLFGFEGFMGVAIMVVILGWWS